MKVEVIELEATKLDPNSTYIMVVDRAAYTTSMLKMLMDAFKKAKMPVMLITSFGDPNKTTKFFSIPREPENDV